MATLQSLVSFFALGSATAATVLLSDCTPKQRTDPPAPASEAGPPSTAQPSSTAIGDDSRCVGREMHDCARTKGCLLDQPTYRKPECRPAENECERAVRHADLIGT